MPFSGGFSPSPEKYGGGDGTGAAPLLQRVFESISRARGKPFDTTTGSIVGAENMALARAITFDLYGASARAAHELNPGSSTVDGLLPRWEKILAKPPNYGDSQYVRQARVATAFARFGTPGTNAAIIAQFSQLLGPVFVGLTEFTTNDALSWWPGLQGSAAKITALSANLFTVADMSAVPTAAPGALLTLSNASHSANNGTFPVQNYVSSSSVKAINNGGPVSPDYGVGGTSGSPTIAWSLRNPATPWMSTLAHVDVQVTHNLVGYQNADGSPNAAFYSAVQQIGPVLDEMLPAHCTWDWYVLGLDDATGWLLDQPDLDLLTFDS